eukprot:6180970-Pleurochrysis_carterae.AAC.2
MSKGKARARAPKKHQVVFTLEVEQVILRQGTKYRWRVLVPRQTCVELLHATHRLLETAGHRGAEALASQLRRHYHWDGMPRARHCEHLY